MSLAEKFQITVPPKKEDNDKWKTFESVRKAKEYCLDPGDDTGFNLLPKTQIHGKCEFDSATGGEHDPSGVKNPKAYQTGFIRREMKATDDQYNGEHVDLFYGEAKDELGNVGFVERNNYLDRL